MKKNLLFVFLTSQLFCNAQNLVFNGNMELFNPLGSTPDGWSSASDFGGFTQNTTDFSEGTSSVEFISGFGFNLMLFTTEDIPLEAGKTYTIKYSYKYLGDQFNSSDNIEFSFFSNTAPFNHGTNIQDNNWNTVTTEFTPAETKSDFEATITINSVGFETDYRVLIDDVQVFETAPLSNSEFSLSEKVAIHSISNKSFKLKKPSDIKISNITAYSVLGKEQQIAKTAEDFSTFNLKTLSSGVYILQILTNKGKLVKKVFVK